VAVHICSTVLPSRCYFGGPGWWGGTFPPLFDWPLIDLTHSHKCVEASTCQGAAHLDKRRVGSMRNLIDHRDVLERAWWSALRVFCCW